MTHRILIVDDEPKLLDVLGGMLEGLGFEPRSAESGPAALALLATENIDLVLTDLRMPHMTGHDLLIEIRKRQPDMPVVVMTAFSSVRDAVRAIRDGAFDYINKPIEIDQLTTVLANALRLHDALRDNERLRAELEGRHKLDTLVGTSPAFQVVLRAVREVAKSRTTVLLSGESGTGKEIVARAIHFNSPRQAKPFIAVNCAAVPEALLESEFFGHVKGSFTGAIANRTGRFAQAEGGTLFLDEVGDMPIALQAKILRVLQERQYEPVGGSGLRETDVRIIAATNRDLPKMVSEGAFREDLYYRLAVYPVTLPPLRDRLEDIPMLVHLFLDQLGPALGHRQASFTAAAMKALLAYRWPGNIRELQNCVERSLLSAQDGEIDVTHLPPNLFEAIAAPREDAVPAWPVDLDKEKDALERRYVLAALKETNGVQVRAAELLGVNERSLWHRIKKLGIAVSRVATSKDTDFDS